MPLAGRPRLVATSPHHQSGAGPVAPGLGAGPTRSGGIVPDPAWPARPACHASVVVAPEREAVADLSATPDPNCTPQPVPWGGVVARVRASVGLRRLIPTDVALAASDATQRLASAVRPSGSPRRAR